MRCFVTVLSVFISLFISHQGAQFLLTVLNHSLFRAVLSVLMETDHLSAEFRTALWMNSPDSCAVLFSWPLLPFFQ